MDHGLVDGVGGLVGEDARRQARHQLDDLVDPAALHDVVVDEDVLAEELHLVLEVAEQAPDLVGAWKGGKGEGRKDKTVTSDVGDGLRDDDVSSAYCIELHGKTAVDYNVQQR